MTTRLLLLSFLLCINSTYAGAVGFSNYYSPGNWTAVVDGGAIDVSLAPASVALTSSDDQSGEINKFQELAIVAPEGSTSVSFNWSYQTQDVDGPTADDFGWLLNGLFTKLSDSDGSNSQSGFFSANVAAGDVFGFRAYSLDSFGGAATTTISNFSAPVPLPTAVWLFGTGLFGFLWQSKRRNAKIS